MTQQRSSSRTALVALLIMCLGSVVVDAFVSPGVARLATQQPPGWTLTPRQPQHQNPRTGSITELNMFMGSDGGVLGIGTPELFTILLVGYFVLGPSDLYKLTKEVGKFVQNVQTFSAEATSQIENNLEDNLQLEEIRKAQRDLNEAFSFRRSINVDEDSEAFEVNAKSPRADDAEAEAVAAAQANASGKKKIRRRKKKKVVVEEEEEGDEGAAVDMNQGTVANNIPDLSLDDEDDEMSEAERRMMESMAKTEAELSKEQEQEGLDSSEQKRQAYLENKASAISADEDRVVERELASTAGYDMDNDADDSAARFQAQMTGNWNDSILDKEDDLGPLAQVMQKIALLEEEKNAADLRLQEEFRSREENEETFYREKKALLEEAAAKVQAAAYASTTSESKNTTTAATK